MQMVFAYTAPGAGFPEYISVNVTENGVEVTVRSKPVPDGNSAVAAIRLSLAQALELGSALSKLPVTAPPA